MWYVHCQLMWSHTTHIDNITLLPPTHMHSTFSSAVPASWKHSFEGELSTSTSPYMNMHKEIEGGRGGGRKTNISPVVMHQQLLRWTIQLIITHDPVSSLNFLSTFVYSLYQLCLLSWQTANKNCMHCDPTSIGFSTFRIVAKFGNQKTGMCLEHAQKFRPCPFVTPPINFCYNFFFHDWHN